MGQTQGHELPYDVGEKYSCLTSKSIWSVHSGKKKGSGENVTVFVFDHADKSPEEVRLAQAAHLRLKTLRHPNILKYIDGVELPTCIYVVTEEVVPLATYIASKDGSSEFSVAWGIHQILKSIHFLSKDCGLVHRSINLFSVFVDLAGEWKLGGVEFMCGYTGPAPPGKQLEELRRYDPPEASKSSRRSEKWSTDMWGCGCLIWEVYNGQLNRPGDLKTINKIPKSLVPCYSEMMSVNPKSRPEPSHLLESLREHGGFLASNFISIALRIEEVQIMEPMQRTDFFDELNKTLNSFPERFSKHKILPQLINAFEFGGAGSSVLAPLFKLGALLKGEEYQRKIVPCVVKLFSSTDRATRLNLLQQLEFFVDHLLPVTVNDQIFPHIAHGYTDTVPAIRELTVKATVLLAPKLGSATLNGQLLKYLAKCQLDEKPNIRVLTNICLGRIAGHFNPTTRQKVLVTAFLRALKDPFPPARIAAMDAMGATHMYFSSGDISGRILPALCTITMDKEKPVRDRTFKMIRLFLAKLEKLSEDPQAAAEQEKIEASANSWTGWAVSSITSKFYRVSAQSQAMPSSAPKQSITAEERHKESVPASDAAAADPRRTNAPGGTGSPSYQAEVKPRTSVLASGGLDDWQDEEWEDVSPRSPGMGKACNTGTVSSSDNWKVESIDEKENDDSDMEGWEDDGWGTFGSTPALHDPSCSTENSESSQHQPLSSGADFFDSFSPGSSGRMESKPITKDPFNDMWSSVTDQQSHKSKAPTSPLPPASSLFGSSSESKSSKFEPKAESESTASKAVSTGGWDEWNEEDFEEKPSTKVEKEERSTSKTETNQGGSVEPSWGNEDPGWGNEGSDWGTGDSGWGASSSSSSSKSGTGGTIGVANTGADDSLSKQELRQKRMEERRLKQLAAREKRAAGSGSKPGLGAVKKD